MLADQLTQLSFAQLFDTLPNGVLYYRAVRNVADQHLVDFIVDYANPAFQKTVQSRYQATIGTSVRHDNRHDTNTTEFVFAQLKAVAETGQPSEFEYYNPLINEWLSVSRAKAGDGVLSVSRIITASKQAAQANERQQSLLNGILNTSLNTTFVYEAIRDDAGHIQDFSVLLVNEQGRREVNARTGIDPVGKTLLSISPNSRQSGQFNLFCQVVESGEPVQGEQFYPNAQAVWYNTAITKLNDGVVVTGIDITAQKQIALEAERQAKENKRQANYLNNVLDASSNGIVAERAIRDAGGTIIDFQIMSANRQAAGIAHSSVAELVGRSDLELHPELRSSGLFDAYVKTVETGESQFVETYYNDGKLDHWTEISTRKLADEELVITFSNVSDVKRTQQALERAAADNKAQAELMQTMLDGAINAVMLLEPVRDEAGTVTDFSIKGANPAVQKLTGADPDTAVGKTMLAVYPNYKQGGFFALYCEVLTTGQPQWKEFYYEDDAFNGWFDISVARQGDGIVLTFANTTEARLARQTNEQARANLQAVIDSSQTGIFVFSPVYDETGSLNDFRFKTINRMVAALVGQTPDAITGALASDWFVSYRNTPLFGHYKRTFETGESQRFDVHYNVDGFDVWFDVQSVKFGDDVLVTFTNYTDLKRAQLAVEQISTENQRQAELLNSVLDGSINGIMAFESVRSDAGAIADFVFLSSNEAANQLVNRPAGALIGKRLLSVFPGNLESGLFDKYINTVETGVPTRTETHYQLDGLDFWLDISAQKLGDGFVVTFTDISVVKRATRLVEESAHHLQTVVDMSQTAIFLLAPLYDDDGTISDFSYRALNQTLADYVRQTPASMIGTPVSQWFPTYKTTGFNFQRYCNVFETHQSERFEIHYDADGIEAWLDVSVARVGDEILVTFLDYSPLKKLQQQLESSATELQTVIDTSQTGIFLFSPVRSDGPDTDEVIDFRFRLANRQLASYVGQEPEAVIGALGSEWFPDYKTNGLFDYYQKVYLTGESQRFDIHYEGSGIDAWLDIMATKLGDEVLVTFSDYTSLKKLQQQLESSVVDLQRSNANLEQFAYVASHDLQEPLRKIQAFGDIIQTNYAPVIGNEGADMIRRMQSAAARMQVLIKDVLAYSRVATKRDDINPVDLNQLVANVVDDLETAIADRKVAVTVDSLPTIMGDDGQLRQLFQNLLSNALKFTKPRHTPDETRVPEQQNAFITVTARTRWGRDTGMAIPPGDADRLFHLIEVADNGIGFEPHQAERIFQVFQRLHSRSAYQGTGIGLAIVKKVVENHNGHIQAMGRPGEGATFRILLPA